MACGVSATFGCWRRLGVQAPAAGGMAAGTTVACSQRAAAGHRRACRGPAAAPRQSASRCSTTRPTATRSEAVNFLIFALVFEPFERLWQRLWAPRRLFLRSERPGAAHGLPAGPSSPDWAAGGLYLPGGLPGGPQSLARGWQHGAGMRLGRGQAFGKGDAAEVVRDAPCGAWLVQPEGLRDDAATLSTWQRAQALVCRP